MAMKMIRKVRRMRDHPTAAGPGRTLCYMTPSGSKRAPTRFFDLDQVPEFEGEEAWFEVEPCRGQVWMTWRFIRQVDEAGRPILQRAGDGVAERRTSPPAEAGGEEV